MSNPVEVTLNLPHEVLVEALTDLGTDDFVSLVKAVDERLADWALISLLKPWVDEEHRKMVREETEDLSQRTEKCVRATEYSDIWVHTNPHKGCVLRSAHP